MYALVRQLILVLNQVVVSFLLAMRIMAMYDNSRRIIILVVGVGFMLLGISCWSLVGQHSSIIPDVQGCHTALTSETGIRIAVAWKAQATFDLLVFGLTVRRTYETRRTEGHGFTLSGEGIADLLYRDGAICFMVMTWANISNILTFYLAPRELKGVLSTFASCISITLMSRLMLNLHKTVVGLSDMRSIPVPLSSVTTS